MFLGEYRQKLTGKGRILLPLKLRQQIQGENIVLSKGFEKCLFGYDEQRWQEMAQKQLRQSSLTNRQDRNLRRYLFSGAAIASLDQQGRFVIPENLLQYAAIENEALLIGAGDHFEIWLPQNWAQHLQGLENEIGDWNLEL